MAGKGHEDQFPSPMSSDRCRFSQETFARSSDNGRSAPIAVTDGAPRGPLSAPPQTFAIGCGASLDAPIADLEPALPALLPNTRPCLASGTTRSHVWMAPAVQEVMWRVV